MKIKKTRYIANVATKEGMKIVPLFNRQTGEGTSGEGTAFAIARKLLSENGMQGIPFNVQKVEIETEIDIAKAVAAGAVGTWNIVK